MDILPRPRPQPPAPDQQAPEQPTVSPSPASKPAVSSPISTQTTKYSSRPVTRLHIPWYRKTWLLLCIVIGIVVAAAAGAIIWYYMSLTPKTSEERKIQLVVNDGESSSEIIHEMTQLGLVRSKLATRLYVELSGNKSKLQAGAYILSPTQSVQQMIEHISAGKTDEQLVTILPGQTLKQLRASLKSYGYDDDAITAALNKQYNHPLLADKPASVSLEGYIYPESFKVIAGRPLSELFERSFDEMYRTLQNNGSIEAFHKQGLNLHQAITLASIVQKEVSDPAVQPQVAQVFLSRLKQNMVLGSDVTFEYAADLLGVTPAVNINSPYNTRQNPGLPPGPIANMEYSALKAVAQPAPGDYLFFVAGDDGKTYFSRTAEEHQANVNAHCHDLCRLY